MAEVKSAQWFDYIDQDNIRRKWLLMREEFEEYKRITQNVSSAYAFEYLTGKDFHECSDIKLVQEFII